MPCPAIAWAHPDQQWALEVQVSRRKDREYPCYHIFCPVCKTRSFLAQGTWRSGWGLTVVEAEYEGFQIVGLSLERKEELLKELGLKLPPEQRGSRAI